jgi:hypothetical protein
MQIVLSLSIFIAPQVNYKPIMKAWTAKMQNKLSTVSQSSRMNDTTRAKSSTKETLVMYLYRGTKKTMY